MPIHSESVPDVMQDRRISSFLRSSNVQDSTSELEEPVAMLRGSDAIFERRSGNNCLRLAEPTPRREESPNPCARALEK